MNRKLLFMLNCLPTIVARYMYECLHNYFMVRLPYQFSYKGCRMMTSLLFAVPQYHALLVAMYEQESQNHLCIIIAQFS